MKSKKYFYNIRFLYKLINHFYFHKYWTIKSPNDD